MQLPFRLGRENASVVKVSLHVVIDRAPLTFPSTHGVLLQDADVRLDFRHMCLLNHSTSLCERTEAVAQLPEENLVVFRVQQDVLVLHDLLLR